MSTITRLDRPSALTDMPAGLTEGERNAYIRGYAKGAQRYTRKYGSPAVTGHPVNRLELRRLTREHETDRHPHAHRAALRELKTYRSHPARGHVADVA